MKKLSITSVFVFVLILCFGVSFSAVKNDRIADNLESYEMTNRMTPTLDGEINDGEYAVKLDMSGDNEKVYWGKFKGTGTFWFAWDDDALYFAAEVKGDTTRAYCTDDNPANHDHIRLLINPNNILDYYKPVYEFDISPTEDGKAAIERFNFGLNEYWLGESLTERCESVCVVEKKVFRFEIAIPWEIFTEVPEFDDFDPTATVSYLKIFYCDYTDRSVENGGDYHAADVVYGHDHENPSSDTGEFCNLAFTFGTPRAKTDINPLLIYAIVGGVFVVAAVVVVIVTHKKKA